MSIEQSLERIADSLERLVAVHAGNGALATDVETKKPGRPKKVDAAPVVDVDPLTGEPVASTPVAELTLDQVRASLRVYMKTNGIDKTKAVMQKFGADPKNPLITQVPKENYGAMMKEIGA